MGVELLQSVDQRMGVFVEEFFSVEASALGDRKGVAENRGRKRGTAFWMIHRSDIQRPRMVTNVWRLPERREADASYSWGNPVARTQSRTSQVGRASWPAP